MKNLIVIASILIGLIGCKVNQKKTDPSTEFYQWAPTPPMGWNSWDCYGPTVFESEVRANADYMAENLKKYGWEYIVVDIRWYLENDKAHGYNQTDPKYTMDEYGRFTPAVKRFPSATDGKGFKPLADYIHSKGLKFGIHVMRGIPVEAVKKNTPILDSKAKAQDIYTKDNQCDWLHDMYTIVPDKEGAQAYYNSILKLYASWDVDFIKVDNLSNPYFNGEIEMIRKAIDLTGRKIVFSTSPGNTPLDKAEHVQKNANMWRMIGDFWDRWYQLKDLFTVCNKWTPYIGEGHWPDADMLPLGRIGIRAEHGDDRMTAFTKDEQITLMTLFSIFRSPLMFGGDLPSNDAFTLSLLTNEEVLDIHKNSINNKQLFRTGDLIAWTADDPKTKDKYLALFNASDTPDSVKISVKLEQLGLKGNCTVRDLWSKKDMGKFNDEFASFIKKHGAGLYKVHSCK
jgi:alpha-galactosidase